MKKRRSINGFILLLILGFQGLQISAQNRAIDSLSNLVDKGKDDTTQVLNHVALANLYTAENNYDLSWKQILQGYRLCKTLNYERGLAMLYRAEARMARSKGEIDRAIDYFLRGLVLFEKLGEGKMKANCCGALGNLYYEKGAFDKSASFMLKAVKAYDAIGDKKNAAGYYGNLGAIYESMKDYKKALTVYEKANSLCKEIDYQQGIAINLVCIANLYMDWNQNEKALDFDFQALKINEGLGDSSYISNNLSNISVAYQNLHNYHKALEYAERANATTPRGDQYLYLSNLVATGDILMKLKEYKKAETIFLQAEQLLEKFSSITTQSKNYLLLSTVYDSLGNFRKSLQYFKKHAILRDSIFNDDNRRKILDSQLQFEYNKKATADSLLAAEEKKLVSVKLKQQRTENLALTAGIILVAIFGAVMFNRFRVTHQQKLIIEAKETETQFQKQIIEAKHLEITDSINYAERIQRSFLATQELLDANLKDYFVMFQPKSVVSGDFYWARNIPQSGFMLITGDSTGHGVPGAIVSLLNITSIESAIKEGYHSPGTLLDETRNSIIERLSHDGSEGGGKDGMDCIACLFDFNRMILKIAAANNPAWIVRDALSKDTKRALIEIRPDKMPVGRHQKETTPFKEHEIPLHKGDVVYTLTDGYADQFGGPDGKKFMVRNLKTLLANNAHLSMAEQKLALEKTFKEWKGTQEQVDDVCIIGIRV